MFDSDQSDFYFVLYKEVVRCPTKIPCVRHDGGIGFTSTVHDNLEPCLYK